MQGRKYFSLALATALVALFAAAPITQAAGPKTGSYYCTYNDGGRLFGYVKILKRSKYRFNDNAKGKYKTKGKKLKFKTGSMKGVYAFAKWKRGDRDEIFLYDDRKGFGHSALDVYCWRQKK